jgi:hypothetical protein
MEKGGLPQILGKNLLGRERDAKFCESMKFNKKKPVPFFEILWLNGHQVLYCDYYNYSKNSKF